MDKNKFLENNNFLPQDIEIILDKYEVYDCDLLIRKAVDYVDKPIILYGIEKRIELAKRKAKQAHGDSYLEKFIFKDNNSIVSYIESILRELKGAEENYSAVDSQEDYENSRELSEEELNLLTGSMIAPLEVEDSPDKAKAVYKKEEIISDTVIKDNTLDNPKEEKNNSEEKNTKPYVSASNNEGGLCHYGVPKLRVREFKPNVIGLKESLYEEVNREELDDFFQKLSNRAVKSLEEGWYL